MTRKSYIIYHLTGLATILVVTTVAWGWRLAVFVFAMWVLGVKFKEETT